MQALNSPMFQSLIGFKINWNTLPAKDGSGKNSFNP